MVWVGRGVDEEEVIMLIRGYVGERVREFEVEVVDERVGIEREVVEVVGEDVEIVRMGMRDGDKGMRGIEVEILVRVVVG